MAINKEVRTILDGQILQLRSDGLLGGSVDDKPVIEGHAAVFDQRTEIFGMFTESIKRGAFKNALKANPYTRALFNHDANMLLGTTKAGTLTMREDDTGLYTEIFPSVNTSVGKDVVEWLRRGELDGMSFAFTVKRQEWIFAQDSKKMDHREIVEVGELYDVGPVTYPAYNQTKVKVRQEAEEVYREARSRFEARSRAGTMIQVPEGLDMGIECRSGELWVPEKRETDPAPEEKKPEEANENGTQGQEAPPAQTDGEKEKSPEGETAPSENKEGEAKEPSKDEPAAEPEQNSARGNPEILLRELEITRGKAKAKGIV